MEWLDRRLTTWSVIPSYIRIFKSEWREHVGSEELIPQEYRDKIKNVYDELKKRDHGEIDEKC
ncbi:hypothetical protein [Paenibacillus pini]|nr:hypothetical protein [Paenibacillus pini]